MLAFWLLGVTTIVLAAPSKKGAFCCHNNNLNKISNGNFESGNSLFNSDYLHDYDTIPGHYVVSDSASQFAADVDDHSYCESSTAYPTNSKFLLVNGLTNMPSGSKTVIWKRTISLKSGSEYRFCGNFKNLPQPTWDVLPEITVKLSTGISHSVTIDTDSDQGCDWQKVSFCFFATASVTVEIVLKEDSLGDGNDLAVDDISVQELVDPALTTTVMHQWGTQVVYASINTIFDPNDDYLPFDPEECNLNFPWYWFVLTLSNGVPNFAAPWGVGNEIGSWRINPWSSGSPWGLTTNFPGFTFQWGKMYALGMTTNRCCKECVKRGWTWHVVFIGKTGIPTFKDSFLVKEAGEINSKKSLSISQDTLSRSNSESEYSSGSGLQVTASRSVEKDVVFSINAKDLTKIDQTIEKYESSKSFQQLYAKHESNAKDLTKIDEIIEKYESKTFQQLYAKHKYESSKNKELFNKHK